MSKADAIFSGQNDRSFNGILKFPDIARPGVAAQALKGLGGDGADILSQGILEVG